MSNNLMKKQRKQIIGLMGFILFGSLFIVSCASTPEGCTTGDCGKGAGSYQFGDGSVFNGTYKDGKRNGPGNYTWKNGDSYNGTWKDGKMHGQGLYKWKNGDEYSGEWKDGVMDGRGTYKFSDGSKVEGTFSQGKYIPPKKEEKPADKPTEKK